MPSSPCCWRRATRLNRCRLAALPLPRKWKCLRNQSLFPGHGARRSEGLWQTMLGKPVPLTLAAFATECGRLVTRDHDAARAIGVKYPEVFWPQIVAEARPELAGLSAEARNEFVFQHAQLRHTV